MKNLIVQRIVNKKIFTLLFSFLAFIGLWNNTNAQGWTFTFQLALKGPCGSVTLPVLPTFPNMRLPTQSSCESMRQLILNISASTPVYDNQGHQIGVCTVYYNCSQCSGSDIVTPGQVNPGDVSFNGEAQGSPFFTSHQSEAFEDWAKDYKALLESYGITSILGNTLTAFGIPSTGDKNFDNFYSNQSDEFNPTVTNGQNKDGNTMANNNEDTFLNSTPTMMGGSPMTTEEMQRQALINKYGPNYVDQMNMYGLQNIPNDGSLNGEQPSENSWGEATLKTALGAPEVYGTYFSFVSDVAEGSLKNVNQVVTDLTNGNYEQAETDVKSEGQIVFNSLLNTGVGAAVDAIGEKATEIASEGLPNALNYTANKIGIASFNITTDIKEAGTIIGANLYKMGSTAQEWVENYLKKPGE